VARDKNTTERPLRNPVGGRKHEDGSGSVWSAPLATRMGSVWQTALLGGLHPPPGRRAFCQACAAQGGTCPTDLRAFLPWQRTPERSEARARPAPLTVSPLTDQAEEGDARAVVDPS
jgi:transposase